MTTLNNLPVPPTDNLYKFMAISGLVIVILCLVLPAKQVHDLSIQIAQAEGEMALYEFDYDQLSGDVDRATEAVDRGVLVDAKSLRQRKVALDRKETVRYCV